uniref:hypothetical protein n=1 Tax=Oceanospirillum sanctuarii TaxID=1434821 RepID=UPI001C3C6A81
GDLLRDNEGALYAQNGAAQVLIERKCKIITNSTPKPHKTVKADNLNTKKAISNQVLMAL